MANIQMLAPGDSPKKVNLVSRIFLGQARENVDWATKKIYDMRNIQEDFEGKVRSIAGGKYTANTPAYPAVNSTRGKADASVVNLVSMFSRQNVLIGAINKEMNEINEMGIRDRLPSDLQQDKHITILPVPDVRLIEPAAVPKMGAIKKFFGALIALGTRKNAEWLAESIKPALGRFKALEEQIGRLESAKNDYEAKKQGAGKDGAEEIKPSPANIEDLPAALREKYPQG